MAPQIADPERLLALAYADAERRGALALLWQLDERLAGIVVTTSQPAIGQMRLTWWHQALDGLGTAPAPAEPLLMALAACPQVVPARLLPLIDGWEALLDAPPLDEAALSLHAEARGAALFAAAADLLGPTGLPDDEIAAAGRLWALIDAARRLTDPASAGRALALARAELGRLPRRWPRPLAPLGLLAVLARADARAPQPARQGAPRRIARALWFRIARR
ncbi:squalene/phytoene synthase family protein [Sphingomonas changnyeongensis]|uniref:Squalene/phytoene synthase family protein n=1 Tax=Sphingomonas changnyeongensis TaxID=2698679 RepID=A0A7Z2S851_9SPHN|nr:squalene/phytoene synthase family protein [Sphingomonas changnyeongensis]QHL91036.1 squalene/phytoene synthase family protein [Sphingomonas changnyeongensis]